MKLKTFILIQFAFLFSFLFLPNQSFSETAYPKSESFHEKDLSNSKSDNYKKFIKKKKKKFRLFKGKLFKKKLQKLSEKLQSTDPFESAKKCVNYASAGYGAVLGALIFGNIGIGALALICLVLSIIFPIVSISHGKKAKPYLIDAIHEEEREKVKLGITLSKILLTLWVAMILVTWFWLTQVNFD